MKVTVHFIGSLARGRDTAAVALDRSWSMAAVRPIGGTQGECFDEGTVSRKKGVIVGVKVARRHSNILYTIVSIALA